MDKEKIVKRIKVNQRAATWLTVACCLIALGVIMPSIKTNIIAGIGVTSCLVLLSGLNTALRFDRFWLWLMEQAEEYQESIKGDRGG